MRAGFPVVAFCGAPLLRPRYSSGYTQTIEIRSVSDISLGVTPVTMGNVYIDISPGIYECLSFNIYIYIYTLVT